MKFLDLMILLTFTSVIIGGYLIEPRLTHGVNILLLLLLLALKIVTLMYKK